MNRYGERTPKKWKAFQLVGGLLMSIGTIWLIGEIGWNSTEPPGTPFPGRALIPLAMVVIGVPTFILGHLLAWWYHG